ncbi:uncharacterized protein G2W53_011433 [Senna tora]|uniref:Uncharacterized protein n=1 Tax=Senna tora TaxID=362788 RepID=A0A834X1Z1_9FABA|nr:uncharacterized protein G2W53_011433 [Senna tora]
MARWYLPQWEVWEGKCYLR